MTTIFYFSMGLFYIRYSKISFAKLSSFQSPMILFGIYFFFIWTHVHLHMVPRLKEHDILSNCCLFSTKSLIDTLLVLRIIASPIFVDLFLCCFDSIFFGNSWCVPCSFYNMLSLPCWFVHALFQDGLWSSPRSLCTIVFVGPGFAPCSLLNISYVRHSYTWPYHPLATDLSSWSCAECCK